MLFLHFSVNLKIYNPINLNFWVHCYKAIDNINHRIQLDLVRVKWMRAQFNTIEYHRIVQVISLIDNQIDENK